MKNNNIPQIQISGYDVLKVANRLHIKITNKQVEQVLERYKLEYTEDPTATWDLVVENIIYNL